MNSIFSSYFDQENKQKNNQLIFSFEIFFLHEFGKYSAERVQDEG